jgi:glycosyltransferase involved in cell wall biosynthesis
MIYLALPFGSLHGWGVCGKNLGRELLQLTPVRYLTFDGHANGASEFERAVYRELTIDTPPEHSTIIQAADWDLGPVGRPFDGVRKVGLVFCDRVIPEDRIKRWAPYWDHLIAGSTWCQQVLAAQGIDSEVICQGVDHLTFNEGRSTKEFLKNDFVVFSGGKFEYRKGQDLVIRAFQIFHEKYKDAMLIAAWFNGWSDSMRTMQLSPHITFTTKATQYKEIVNHTLVENGIPLDRVLVLGPAHNSMLAGVYQNSDVGLFPNRAENGTNLVLMEFMACGKPAIVSDFAGHKDIANRENTIILEPITPFTVYHQEEVIGTWGESSVSTIVERLEWAYHNRDRAALIGKAASASMKTMTWRRMAESVLDVVRKLEHNDQDPMSASWTVSEPREQSWGV